MPTIEWNKEVWNRPESYWEFGDKGWENQAKFCGQPYEEWKRSIAETFLLPNIANGSTVLEIAPGCGRWTEFIIQKAAKVILVDLNPYCIDICKKRFSSFRNVSYHLNDGKSLAFIQDSSVDFIWSFDSFVHMEKDVIAAYFKEFSKVLKIGGRAVIHHAGRKNFTLCLSFLPGLFGKYGKYIYQVISIGKFTRDDGSRSNISRRIIEKIAKENNLKLIDQVNSWGKTNQYNVKLFNDWITIMVKV